MANKRHRLDKLDRLRILINGWADDESKDKSEEHKLNIQSIIRSDHQFVTQLIYGVTTNAASVHLQITGQDMKRCNTIYKRYSAISNVQFGDKDPFEGVTIVKPDDTR